jgi:hypothetical protein
VTTTDQPGLGRQETLEGVQIRRGKTLLETAPTHNRQTLAMARVGVPEASQPVIWSLILGTEPRDDLLCLILRDAGEDEATSQS